MKYDKYTNLIIAISLNHFYNIMPRTSISGYNRNLNTSFNDWVKRTSIYLNEPIPEYFKTILDDNEDCINLGYFFITLMHLYQKTYHKYYKDNNNLKNTVEVRNFKNNIRNTDLSFSEKLYLFIYGLKILRSYAQWARI